MRRAETKYRDIFEHAVEGMFQATSAGRFVTVNPEMARLLGYASPEELIRSVSHIRELYVRAERHPVCIREISAAGSVTGFETELYRRDGRVLWVSINARVVRGAAGTVALYEGRSGT